MTKPLEIENRNKFLSVKEKAFNFLKKWWIYLILGFASGFFLGYMHAWISSIVL
ncbi:MAG: hypothetical protein ACTSUE_19545 [Promethearchaeota archaeon]